jgi:hypothetical protein
MPSSLVRIDRPVWKEAGGFDSAVRIKNATGDTHSGVMVGTQKLCTGESQTSTQRVERP